MKLSYVALFFGLISMIKPANASDMKLIKEFRETSISYNQLSIELSKDVAELLQVPGCVSVAFDSKFSNVFRKRNIAFEVKKTILGDSLQVNKCSGSYQNLYRLLNLVKDYQKDSMAWGKLYQKALESASQTSEEAKRELKKLVASEKKAIADLKSELEKKKPNKAALKRVLYTALMIVGGTVAIVSGLIIGAIFLSAMFGAALVGAGTVLLVTLGTMIVGGAASAIGSSKNVEMDEAKVAYEQLQNEIEDRVRILEGTQKYINAIDKDETSESFRLY